MARYTGPTSRINRRFGQPIFQSKKANEKKPYLPGIHGKTLRRKVTDYSQGLNEKQKLRYMYGLTEKQFRLTFERAKKQHGVTGEVFMQLLECRLDNIVYLLGYARTRTASRQMAQRGLDDTALRTPPAWLERVEGAFKGTISRLPIRDEMDKSINEQLIVEFYSR